MLKLSRISIRSIVCVLCFVLHAQSGALKQKPYPDEKDPYKNIPLVTNTIAWPYSSTTYGTDTFQLGSLATRNEDTLILESVKKNGFKFPASFDFGAACAAYQYEGNRVPPSANNPDGVGWSIWDVFSKDGSWLNPNGNNIEKVPPTSLYTYPNGSEAIDGFAKKFYSQDLEYVKGLGAKVYRLSISWPRLFPHSGMTTPDPAGIEYYVNVLKLAKEKNLKVLITLYHWDLPAWLYNFGDPTVTNDQNKTYGWIDMSNAKDNLVLKEFQKYVTACYEAFGSYTKYFSTFNEPWTFTVNSFIDNVHAPGQYGFSILRALNPNLYGATLDENLSRIPYLQAINIIKAHYIAYKTIHYLYDQNPSDFNNQKPDVNIVLNIDWAEPFRIVKSASGKLSYNTDDIKASKRSMDFMLGWWLEPVIFGTWPKNMDFIYNQRITSVGLKSNQDDSCLRDDGVPISCSKTNPQTLADYVKLGGALDSMVINHYSGYFVTDTAYAQTHISDTPFPGAVPYSQYHTDPNPSPGWYGDQRVYNTQFRYYLYGTDGNQPEDNKAFVIGNAGNKPWQRQTFFVYRKILQYIDKFYLQNNGRTKQNKKYSDLEIYLTENGTSEFHESQKTTNILHDPNRIEFIVGNIAAVAQAVVKDNINVKLYTYWSLADNFEWSNAYDSRFGLLWIDYEGQNEEKFTRKPKDSYYCFQGIIANKSSSKFPEKCL